MDYRELQDILTENIETLEGLRDRLNIDGEPLSTADKQILKEQLSGNWLREMQSEQRHFFAQGNRRDMEHGLNAIFKVMEQLQ